MIFHRVYSHRKKRIWRSTLIAVKARWTDESDVKASIFLNRTETIVDRTR